LSSAGLALYLLIATFLGHHFSLGFIWANRGDGCEFPVLWCVIILSFTVIKPMLFTIDEYILKNFKLPKFFKIIIEF
jgi:putative oxidoreductase